MSAAEEGRPRSVIAANAPRILLGLVPAAMTVYLGFRAGGFFIGATGGVALILLLLLAGRVLIVPLPAEGINLTVAIAVARNGPVRRLDAALRRLVARAGARVRGVRSRAAVRVRAARVRSRANVAAAPAGDGPRARARRGHRLRSGPDHASGAGHLGVLQALLQSPPELPDHVLERVRAAGRDRHHDLLRPDVDREGVARRQGPVGRGDPGARIGAPADGLARRRGDGGARHARVRDRRSSARPAERRPGSAAGDGGRDGRRPTTPSCSRRRIRWSC